MLFVCVPPPLHPPLPHGHGGLEEAGGVCVRAGPSVNSGAAYLQLMTQTCELIVAFVYLFPERFSAQGRSHLSVKDLPEGSFVERQRFFFFFFLRLFVKTLVP